ncbi:cyclin-dependent protein kinase inhibitor SMR9-like [Magnolia sinica]|uniref:cyclin-dependent protein kinase inhibitor SMR9-like n=1 Tax=Magnolia sinica TaxID=86752 RepID=UPI0026592B04|nr:cyclin-dependent protein kinase inhibitor SMR9-like [Magnolia sinica]
MAPACRKRRRSQYRKSKEIAKELPCISMSASPSTLAHLQAEGGENSSDISSNGCSTPKSPRFRIPELLTCPPAPKKHRVALHCSTQKPNISFFNPPDLEIFFFFALRNVSV